MLTTTPQVVSKQTAYTTQRKQTKSIQIHTHTQNRQVDEQITSDCLS